MITLALAAALLAAALVARVWMSEDGFAWPGADPDIWAIRLSRVVSGLVVGAALGTAGVFLQSLLRNPLAAPDLIGPGAGATLAVTLATYFSTRELTPLATAPAAFIGAISVLALVYLISQRRGFLEPVILVLVGVMISLIAGATTLLIAHLMPPNQRLIASGWALGSLPDDASSTSLLLSGAIVLACLIAGLSLAPSMDVAALSEDEAQSTGVNLSRLRLLLFLASGALTAAAIVIAGPIAFIGLVSPHIVRLLAGPSHRPLILGAAMVGGALLIAADIGVRAIRLDNGRMPIGIVTAIIGGPVFIALLRTDPLRRGY
jgi:iron complex transport system permease protein